MSGISRAQELSGKIRGYRIETAQVETALLAVETIKEAVVIARDIGTGDKRPVVYVVAAGKPAPSVNELRSVSSAKLPNYMVPSAIIFLNSLPLTAKWKN